MARTVAPPVGKPYIANVIRILRNGILLLLLLVIGVANGCTLRQPNRPHVVVVLIDTLRADQLPFYGYGVNTAPFLSWLAERSIVFDNAWSTSSWTAPATASLFTSLYPFQHGVITGLMYTEALRREDPRITVNRIADEITTLPEVLQQAGYRTFGVSDNPNVCAAEGFEQGFDRFANYNYRNAEVVNDQVLEWAEEITSSDPYFLYLHYMDPHSPYHPRDERARSIPADDEYKKTLASYDSEIRFVDAHVAALFDRFAWDENTIVIVLSDHGEEFWERGGLGHGNNLYTESLRIPLLVYFPGGDLTPLRVERNVSIVDVLPTIRSLVGLDPGETDEGVDLLQPPDGADDRTLYAHLWRRRGTVDPDDDLLAEGVVSREWKYMSTLPGGEKLFNLALDPVERRSVLADEQNRARGLRAAYAAFVKNSRKYRSAESSISADDEMLKKLRSLGYVR